MHTNMNPSDSFRGKNGAMMGMEETKAMKKGYIIFCTAILIMVIFAVSPVSASMPIFDKGAKVTYNTFTIRADTMDKYAKVAYGVQLTGKRMTTQLVATPKTATTFTITVPWKWSGKKIYYEVYTWRDQYGNGGNHGPTFWVQLKPRWKR